LVLGLSFPSLSPISGWFPTLAAAAGNPKIEQQLLWDVKLGDRTYKNPLDGLNQLDLLLGKGPSARGLLLRRPPTGCDRIDDFKFQFLQQPYGWPCEKVMIDMPIIVNLRQDPLERTPSIRAETLTKVIGSLWETSGKKSRSRLREGVNRTVIASAV
jgi:hypothetical protein